MSAKSKPVSEVDSNAILNTIGRTSGERRRRCSGYRLYIRAIALLFVLLGTTGVHAAIVAYDLSYPTPTAFGDNTTFDVTAYFEESDITGVGQEDVVLDSLLSTYHGPAFPSNPSFFFNNESTAPCSGFFCIVPNFIPFVGRFQNGNFTGYISGLQPSSLNSPFFIHRQFFGNSAQGNITQVIFFGAPGKGWGETDTALRQNSVTGPYPASVPLPTALILLGSGLLGLSRITRNGVDSQDSDFRANTNPREP